MSRFRIQHVLIAAVLIRVLVAAVSYGTNDAVLWREYAYLVNRFGLLHAWNYDPFLNHPPLPLGWAYLCFVFAGSSFYVYCLVLKVPAILGDLLAIRTIWQCARESGSDERRAITIATLFALNPLAILISSYHGNTDSLMAALLLCAFRFARIEKPFLAGLLLGAAINVKLAPVPCIVLLLAAARSWRGAANALLGLSLCAIPFVIPLIGAREAFIKQALFYLPLPTAWGPMLPFSLNTTSVEWESLSTTVRGYHRSLTLPMLLVLTCALAWSNRRRGIGLLEAATVYCCFLVAWTTASVQYLVWPLPLLAAVRPRLALMYGIAGSAFVIWRYVEFWNGGFPLISYFTINPSRTGDLLGLLPWTMLLVAIIALLRPRAAVDKAAA